MIQYYILLQILRYVLLKVALFQRLVQEYVKKIETT